MKFCPKCGANVEDSKFCSGCGFALDPAPPTASKSKAPSVLMGCFLIFGAIFALLVVIVAIAPDPPKRAEEPKETKPAAPATAVPRSQPQSRPIIVSEGAVIRLRAAAVCAATEETLDEVIRWSARNDREEMVRALIRGGGRILDAGETVKVLDRGFFKAKIRHVATDYECYVVREATDQ